MQKTILLIIVLISLHASAQDYSNVGKKIVFSEILRKAKKYNDIDKALLAPAEVYYLTVSSAEDIQKLSDNIGKFTNLRKLVVQNYSNKSVLFTEAIWNLTQLEYLVLFNFPGQPVKGISNLKKLKYLSLDGLGLSEVPAEVLELDKLEYLDLSCNRLTALPRDMGKLSSLKELELTNNCFARIPVEIEKLSSLQYFTMNNAESNAVLADGTTVCENTITDFPVVLRDMKNLKEVSCFFKVNIDPLLKQQVKDAYPNIKIK